MKRESSFINTNSDDRERLGFAPADLVRELCRGGLLEQVVEHGRGCTKVRGGIEVRATASSKAPGDARLPRLAARLALTECGGAYVVGVRRALRPLSVPPGYATVTATAD